MGLELGWQIASKSFWGVSQCFHNLEVKCMGNVACGVDVHRDFLVATVIGDSLQEMGRFTNDVDGINHLKVWVQPRGYGVFRYLLGFPLSCFGL